MNAIEKIDDKYISGAEHFDPETMKISKSPLIYIAPAAAVAASVAILAATNLFTDTGNSPENFQADNNIQVSDTTVVPECSVLETVENISAVISAGNGSNTVSEISSAESKLFVSTSQSYDNDGSNVNGTSKNEDTHNNSISFPEKTDKPDFTEVSVITDVKMTEVSLTSEPVSGDVTQAEKPSVTVSSGQSPSGKPLESTTSGEDPAPIAPAPCLSYENYDEIIYEIKNFDLSKYPDMFQDSYRTMFERIKCDDFIYAVDDSSNSQISLSDRSITLFPYARYEDIGIGCFAEYNNSLFQVMIHYTDRSIFDSGLGQADYFDQRLGLNFNDMYIINDNVFSVGVFGEKNCAYSYIDDDRYCIIRTSASSSELINFLRSLSLKKISLK